MSKTNIVWKWNIMKYSFVYLLFAPESNFFVLFARWHTKYVMPKIMQNFISINFNMFRMILITIKLSNWFFFFVNYLVYLFWSMLGLPEWNQPVRLQLLHILLSIWEYLLHDNPAIEGNLPNLKRISMPTWYTFSNTG